MKLINTRFWNVQIEVHVPGHCRPCCCASSSPTSLAGAVEYVRACALQLLVRLLLLLALLASFSEE